MNMTSQTANAVTQDQLLLAGSKISHRDIYNQQIGLPLHKKHYYRAEEVDKVFVLINGVLTDVSKNAHRMHKSLDEARREAAESAKIADEVLTQLESDRILMARKDAEIAQLTRALDDMITTNASVANETTARLELQVVTLRNQLDAAIAERDELSQKLADKVEQVRNSSDYTSELSRQVELLSSRIEELSAANGVLISSSREISESAAEATSEKVRLMEENLELEQANAQLTDENEQLLSENEHLRSELAKASRIILAMRG